MAHRHSSQVSLPTIPRTWRDVPLGPQGFRRLLNLWPPYLAAGVRITQILPGFAGATVTLRVRAWNANYFGTAFGGTLFAMSDPFWVLLLINRLGPDYSVLDAKAEIEFLAMGRGDLRTTFEVSQDLVDQLRAEADTGQKVLHWLTNEVVDRQGTVVARIRKQIYVKHRPAGAGGPVGVRARVTYAGRHVWE